MSQDRAQFFIVNIQDGSSKEKFADSKGPERAWTWKFLYPERTSCGFKNIRISVDEARIIIQNHAMPNCVHGA